VGPVEGSLRYADPFHLDGSSAYIAFGQGVA
jgi:hypothetical protein